MSMEIDTKNVRIDGVGIPTAEFEILLRFVGDVFIRASGVEVFRETDVPFVELASQLGAWVRAGAAGDFDYDSMESAVHGLVFFHKTVDGNWLVGSRKSDGRSAVVTNEQLRAGVAAFLAAAPVLVDPFGVDVRGLIAVEGKAS